MTAILRPAVSTQPAARPYSAPRAAMPIPGRADEVKFTSNTLQRLTADGVFEGYASLFDRADLGLDVVAPGAFRNSLTNRGSAGIRMLYQHDPAQPIGVWDRIYEDARGLFVRGRLTLDVAKARDVRALLKAGAIDGLSIGFKALKSRRDPRTGLRRLLEVDLWEISIVTFPMLPEARVANVKLAPKDKQTKALEFERWLVDDAGFTPAEAHAVANAADTQRLKSLDRRNSSASSLSASPLWQRRLLAQMAEAAQLLRQSPRQP
jgi:uncharacterized protein